MIKVIVNDTKVEYEELGGATFTFESLKDFIAFLNMCNNAETTKYMTVEIK